MWTAALSDGSVKVDLSKGTASLHVKDVFVFDAFTVPNSLNHAHPAGHVNAIINSLRMEWNCTTPLSAMNCAVNAFSGNYLEGVATIEVIATTRENPATTCPTGAGNHGFRFVSDATTASNFAQIGSEKNGVFFT